MAYVRYTEGNEQIIEKFGKEVVQLVIKRLLIDNTISNEQFRRPLRKVGLVKSNRSMLYVHTWGKDQDWMAYYEVQFDNGKGAFAKFRFLKTELNDLIKLSIGE